MAKIDKPLTSIGQAAAKLPEPRIAAAARPAESGAASPGDAFERVAAGGASVARLLPGALGSAAAAGGIAPRLAHLAEARGAAAATEAAAAGLGPAVEGAEPDVAGSRGDGSVFPSPAGLATKTGTGDGLFGRLGGVFGMPDATTPTAPLGNAGPSESGGRSGPPLPGLADAMAGADGLHKVRAPKDGVSDGRVTRTELRDGTIVEDRTSRREDGTRVRQTDVFYPDGTSSQRIVTTNADGSPVSERATTYDAEGNQVESHATLPRDSGTGNPGDEPTESQKELGRWLFGQHNVGKHAPLGSGPRSTTLVNPGDPDYEGAGLGKGPRIDPGEGIVVNPSLENAAPGAREMTPELAAQLRRQLEDAVRGPGAPPGGGEGGPGGTGGDGG